MVAVLFVRVFSLYKHIKVYSLLAVFYNSSQIDSEAFSSACDFFPARVLT